MSETWETDVPAAMSRKLVKLGAAAAAGYLGWSYLDEKHGISSDVEYAARLSGLKNEFAKHFKDGYNVRQMWYDVVRKNPGKKCMVFEDRFVTFADVEKKSNQVANWLLSIGIKRGDTIALLMENRPEFVISWLGMTKIGVRVAMINTAIKNKGLLHCVKVSECKMLFFGSELTESVDGIKEDLNELGIHLYAVGDSAPSFCPHAQKDIDQASAAAPSPKHCEGLGMGDIFGYIYTSGTTGLPKAAVILHQKMFVFGAGMGRAFQVKETDVCYTCLPLFHSAGGGLGIGLMLYSGCTVVIKKRFSATEWWKDCVKYKVTVAQYIGELARYLILQKPTQEETMHQVRICIGNGLRPEIWNEFQTRFNVPEIGEFYGSTEGNAALFNHCRSKDAQGACGRMGTLMQKLTGITIVKFDIIEEEPIRGADGFCIPCAASEAGELLFPIKDNDPSTRFAGYSDKKATQKKIIENVFVKGDKYFRTGDLLKKDAKNFFHFVDRIGDTFRWKGENCSTTEVQECMATFPGIEEVNIYGVQIPNNMDGRAPTAAITPIDGDLSKLDLAGLAEHCKKNLPSYAVPLFLRLQPQMALTATLKLQKVELRNAGIEHSKMPPGDSLFWMHPAKKTYVPFTPQDFQDVTALKAKI